jgi:hypothetical protein
VAEREELVQIPGVPGLVAPLQELHMIGH